MKYNVNSSDSYVRRRYTSSAEADRRENEANHEHVYVNTEFPEANHCSSALQRFRRFQDKLHRGPRQPTPKKNNSDQFVVSAFTVAVISPNLKEDPVPRFVKHQPPSRELLNLERGYFERLKFPASKTGRPRKSQHQSNNKPLRKLNISQEIDKPADRYSRKDSGSYVPKVQPLTLQDTNFAAYNSNLLNKIIPRIPVENVHKIQQASAAKGGSSKSPINPHYYSLKSSPRRANTTRKKPELEEGIELKPWEDFPPE